MKLILTKIGSELVLLKTKLLITTRQQRDREIVNKVFTVLLDDVARMQKMGAISKQHELNLREAKAGSIQVGPAKFTKGDKE